MTKKISRETINLYVCSHLGNITHASVPFGNCSSSNGINNTPNIITIWLFASVRLVCEWIYITFRNFEDFSALAKSFASLGRLF